MFFRANIFCNYFPIFNICKKEKYDLIFRDRENLHILPKKGPKKFVCYGLMQTFFIKDENILFIACQNEKPFPSF